MEEIKKSAKRKLQHKINHARNDCTVKEGLRQLGWNAGSSSMAKLVEWMFWDQEFAQDINRASAFQNLVDEFAL